MSKAKTPASPIKRARRLSAEQPLVAIDAALAAFAETRGRRSDGETAEYLDVLARAVLSGAGAEAEDGRDPVEAMLRDRSCDRLACASLLRLLVADDAPFEADARMRRSTAVFDRMLSKGLYRDLGVRENDQSYEKRDRLRTAVDGHEQALVAHVRSLNSLDAMSSFRRELGQLFGARETGAFVAPFLPEGVTRQTLEELLGPAHGTAECSDASLIERADTVERRCRELIERAEELGTRYCEALLGELARTVERLARERLAAAGFLDSAELSVTPRRKRYPLRHPGTRVTIRLDLVNHGPGHAREVSVEVEGSGLIDYEESAMAIGPLAPGARQVHLHGTVLEPTTEQPPGSLSEVLMVRVTWQDSDRSEHLLEEVTDLEEQPGDVQWEELAFEEPYHLEPVRDPSRFVGRKAAVRELVKVVLQSGNARIEGEKRVGKTSLAYAVSTTVEDHRPERYAFIYLESGDFSAHTAEETIALLGEKVARRVQGSDKRLAGLQVPDFGTGLNGLTELFETASELAPDRSFVVVLDEFDALPHDDLYEHGRIGNAFFQTLRSLGSKRNVSFILVGGERMQWVIAAHGQTLNKYKLVPLDYFAEDQMADYAELVRVPVDGRLLFSEEAIEALFGATAGNPWMTKLLLGYLFERQVERRDNEVQAEDVEDAIAAALPKLDVPNFQHFWDDAIRGSDEERAHVSATRRAVFVAMARCLGRGGASTQDDVVKAARSFDVEEGAALEVIRTLLDRSIIRADEQGALSCRVPLFERWLARYGAQKIILGSGDDDALIRKQRAIEEMRPTYEELEDLAKRWRSYRGEDIHPERIAAWLEQFGGPREQRLMMPVLAGLRFYTRPMVDERLRDLHQFVLRELAANGYRYEFSERQRNRDDLLVCGLEGGGSGATHILKRYRDENAIYSACAVDAARVPATLAHRQGIRAVLVLEDFVGTGSTASRRLKELREMWMAEAEWPEGVDLFLLTITGFEEGREKVEKSIKALGLPMVMRIEDALGDEDRCFHDNSRFFGDDEEREQAKALSSRFGTRLLPKTPLGYGQSEAAVCFEYRCPNNTLPVLWNEHAEWKPLFPRH